jgi:hypothetical protein
MLFKGLVLFGGKAKPTDYNDMPDLTASQEGVKKNVPKVPKRSAARVSIGSVSVFISFQMILCLLCIWMSFFTAEAMETDPDDRGHSSKIPKFSGLKQDYTFWMLQFTAVATIGAFAEAFRDNGDTTFGEPECPLTEVANHAAVAALAVAPTDAALKLQVAAWKRNSKAFAALTLAFLKSLFRYLTTANKRASEVIRLMQPEFMPIDRFAMIECQRRY